MNVRTLLVSSALATSAAAPACCGVAMNPFSVIFGEQQNIIIWEPETKTEHFIRRASFESKNKEFGFIAPTPTVPELGEVKDEAFAVAAKAYDAYEEAKRKAELMPPMGCGRALGEAAAKDAGGIEVLQEVDLAGYRATTLRAKDAKALRAWLAENKFKTEASIEEWITHYVKKDWVFTAFILKPVDDVVRTMPVRMTFKTDRPYAPYYVPSVNRGDSESGLQVAFYAAGRYEGELKSVWNGTTVPVREGMAKELSKLTGVKSLPAGLGVTSINANPWPTPDAKEDLYFKRTGDVPDWPVDLNPLKPVIGVTILGLVAYRAVRRAKAKA